MNIAQVSKKYNLTTDTLRYYERIGLIPHVNRTSSGNRDYTEENCRWVEFIKCMRTAGLSIEALIEYVSLFQEGAHTKEARKTILIEQRNEINAKIDELQRSLLYLDHKIEAYDEALDQFDPGVPPTNLKTCILKKD